MIVECYRAVIQPPRDGQEHAAGKHDVHRDFGVATAVEHRNADAFFIDLYGQCHRSSRNGGQAHASKYGAIQFCLLAVACSTRVLYILSRHKVLLMEDTADFTSRLWLALQ